MKQDPAGAETSLKVGSGSGGETEINDKSTTLIPSTEMDFLDINLTQDSSLLLCGIHSPFSSRILKKTILFSLQKNPQSKTKNAGQEFHLRTFSKTSNLQIRKQGYGCAHLTGDEHRFRHYLSYKFAR